MFSSTDWLRRLPVRPADRVVLNWFAWSLAVETDWEVFTRHWDDFCYPCSDDIAVYPAGAPWVLLYSHTHQFTWGRRKRAPV